MTVRRHRAVTPRRAAAYPTDWIIENQMGPDALWRVIAARVQPGTKGR